MKRRSVLLLSSLVVTVAAVACGHSVSSSAPPNDAGAASTLDGQSSVDATSSTPTDGGAPADGGANADATTALDAGFAAHFAPTGIVCLLADDAVGQRNTTLPQSGCWKNAHVAGVSVGTHWDTIQGEPGAIDWTFFDTALAYAADAGKFIGIGVAAGVTTPGWVFEAGAPQVVADINDASQIESQPWNATYLEKWEGVLAAMAAKYDGDPHVAYVYVGGPGREFETFYLRTNEDIAAFLAADAGYACNDEDGGVLPSALCAWIKGSEEIVDFYASAFKETPILLVLANPFGGGTATSAQVAQGQSALDIVTKYATGHHPGHVGIRSDGLRPSYGVQYAGTEAKALTATTVVGFQMSLPIEHLGGTLAQALEAGVSLGADFVEVYQEDCNDDAEAPTLQEFTPLLNANWNASAASAP